MITIQGLRNKIIAAKLFNEGNGCIELDATQSNDSYVGKNTAVFLDNEYQPMCVSANARGGYVKRLKEKKKVVTSKTSRGTVLETDINIQRPVEETVKGDVLILFCSEKVLKLLKQ